MARRKQHEEHENHERWLVSYADFITLLFAFFVVMYSISSVNEGKYRVLSDSLASVFNDAKRTSHVGDPIQIGEANKGDNLVGQPPAGLLEADGDPVPDPFAEPNKQQARLDALADQMEAVLSPYIQDDLVVVRKSKLWVEVEMKSGMLFSSGSAKLAEDAKPVLYRMSQIFREIPNVIHVEGHTDSHPISTVEFPSNWALSAARAAVVVDQLSRDGVAPGRLAAIGYGEHHPVEDNASEQGRFRNRRVAIVLMSPGAARYQAESDGQAATAATTAVPGGAPQSDPAAAAQPEPAGAPGRIEP